MLIIMLILCALFFWFVKKWDDSGKLQSVDAARHSLEISAWVADWQWEEGIRDFRSITDGISSVQMFAAYFDESDNLRFTEEFLEMLPEAEKVSKQGSLVNLDLTIVNDRMNEDGSEVQKDPSIVSRLMATKESRAKHVDEIMDAVEKYNFHGVEIDYEKVQNKDWKNLILFYRELYQRLHAKDKSLRIVLEPRTPIEKISLPKGPVYVMMAYNLYGMHTGPGPKADHSFIAKQAGRLKKVPGKNVIAFSMGGFDWSEDGKVSAVTENKAAELSESSLQPPKRDPASGSLSFQYKDDDHVKHTVWYADEVTLSQWIGVARKAGYDKIAVWRLGDLGEGVLRYLNQ